MARVVAGLCGIGRVQSRRTPRSLAERLHFRTYCECTRHADLACHAGCNPRPDGSATRHTKRNDYFDGMDGR